MAQQPNDQKCETCQFFTEGQQEGIGACRRFPPTAAVGWPRLSGEMWCGEFKENAAEEVRENLEFQKRLDQHRLIADPTFTG